MDADRELDALIAEKVFGWRWMAYPAPNNPTETWLTMLAPPDAPGRICVPNGYDHIWRPSTADAPRFAQWDFCPWWPDRVVRNGESSIQRGFPFYSTDIAAAWQVWDWLRNEGYTLDVTAWPDGTHAVTVARSIDGEKPADARVAEASATSSTAPHAICLAALRAVGVEV